MNFIYEIFQIAFSFMVITVTGGYNVTKLNFRNNRKYFLLMLKPSKGELEQINIQIYRTLLKIIDTGV